MMKTIVVSDTNIFIDLVKLDLLGDLFALPWDVHTTDFVISELTDPVQKAAVTAFIKRNKLTIGRLSSEEVGKIVQRRYTLLTGDRNLRKIAINESIAVHGILYLFDELVSHLILPPKLAVETLKQLKMLNTRLPLDEVDARIKNWESTIKKQEDMR